MLTFHSSCGVLVTDRNGFPIEKESDIGDWLLDIWRIDVPELDSYCLKEFGEKGTEFDILDVAWWDKDRVYHPADVKWRETIFCKIKETKKMKLTVDSKVAVDLKCLSSIQRREVLNKLLNYRPINSGQKVCELDVARYISLNYSKGKVNIAMLDAEILYKRAGFEIISYNDLFGKSEPTSCKDIDATIIDCVGWIWDNGKRQRISVDSMYKYNLISQEEFEEKYPEIIKLKGYKVEKTADGCYLKVGCKKFSVPQIEAFYKFVNICDEENIDVYEATEFISRNAKMLGLNV